MVPVGAIILQPSDERRRSGSHYTPRALTQPIVKKALEPVLAQLGVGSGDLGVGEEKGVGNGELGVGKKASPSASPIPHSRLPTPSVSPTPHSLLPTPSVSPTPEQILSLKVCDPAMGSGAFLVEACRQLGEHLVNAWAAHWAAPAIPPDENEQLHAMRLVAQRCLYGVDKNPMAVALAKLSLWLATLAKDHAFTFLDHALREGDSLVGLSRQQIERFHWDADGPANMVSDFITKAVNEASALRQQIIQSAEGADYTALGKQLRDADAVLARCRFIGDIVVALYFGSTKPKERENERVKRFAQLQNWLYNKGDAEELEKLVAGLTEGEHPVRPFHWEIEFPEVFAVRVGNRELGIGGEKGVGNRELGIGKKARSSSPTPHSPLPTPSNALLPTPSFGFDVIVGNPPFAGKNTIAAGNHPHYPDWLKALHEESHGNADLVAHFFRRAFQLLRVGGTFGLIATNTIAQGDAQHRAALDLHSRRHDLPRQAAVQVAGARCCGCKCCPCLERGNRE
ncbi:MAG: N-6 DNA methylase [Gemmatales bacterium]